MTNEVGNFLYSETIKNILKNCTNKAQKVLADYIVEKSPSTQIYNITDVLYSKQNSNTSEDNTSDILAWVKDRNGISVERVGEGVVDVKYSWTPYIDDLFSYAKTENGLYYTCLAHRLDDNRVIMFFGTHNLKAFTIFESITIELSNLFNMQVNYSHMYESVLEYNKTINGQDPKYLKMLLDSMDICFLAYLTTLLKMFNDLTNKDYRPYKCYIDEQDKPKSNYYRTPTHKKVVKVADKPIVLVLNDNKTINERIREHKSRNGKIHYAFSWVVRGHYRKLHNPLSMGMNRNGERCVPGMTWIETYMKGDENLPLLKRERVVLDERK